MIPPRFFLALLLNAAATHEPLSDEFALIHLRARVSKVAAPVVASSNDVVGGTCLISAAIGDDYIRMAALTGKSKAGYARRWNYTNLQYEWASKDAFLDWCHGTELGARFEREQLSMNHPTLKYCVIHHALAQKGCKRALWTDGDAVIMNWNVPVDFSWPGAVMTNSTGRPWALYSMLSLPGGLQSQTGTGRVNSDYCLTEAPCRDFKKFWTCLNSGVFILDSSATARAYMMKIVEGAVAGLPRKVNCSTAAYNPLGADQCRSKGGMWDQCLSGCIWQQQQREKGGSEDEMPEGVLCTDGNARPQIQQAFGKWHFEDPKRYIDAETFVVNVAGDKKEMLVEALAEFFPHLMRS